MVIRTLTCHDVYNYGASLQAFALQKYLNLLGHDTSIIDYKPSYLNIRYRLNWFVNPNSPHFNKCKKNILYRVLYITKRYLSDFGSISRKKVFHEFKKKYLITTKRYDNYIQLCQDPPIGDVYIVGSDQVWNNKPLLNGWDAAFFLQFGHNSVKRLSYAASFGSTKSCPDIMSRWINSLDAVSIREKTSLNLMQGVTKPVEVVCDPVFLLNKEEWISTLELSRNKKDYILIYNLSGDNTILINHARLLAEAKGLKLHYIVIDKKLPNAININGVGPKEFLEEILNASYVFSDSFHATAFALIFNKEFFTYQFKSEQASQRMIQLLEAVNQEERYNPETIDYELSYNKDEITNLLERYINESKNWLKKNL